MDEDDTLERRPRTEPAQADPDEPLQSDSAPMEEIPFHVPRD